MNTLDFLKDKTKLIFEIAEDKQNNSLFFYGDKDCFEFFQNRQKTMKYNHKFIKVSKQQYIMLLDACYDACIVNQKKMVKEIKTLLTA